VQVDAKLAGSSVHHAQAFGHDFFANAISGNDSDAVFAHVGDFLKQKNGREFKTKSLATKCRERFHLRDARTTQTP
jgi:hypothetical protein